MPGSTPSQTVGPFFDFGLPFEGGEQVIDPSDPDALGSRARCTTAPATCSTTR